MEYLNFSKNYLSKLYIGIATSESSALSICAPLIFEMPLMNGALFLNTMFLFLFAPSGLVTVTAPFTIIYASLKSYKSGLSIDVFNSDFIGRVVSFF